MGESANEIVWQLTPERVMPADLSPAQHVMLFEGVEILACLVHRTHRVVHVRRDVIADARTDLAASGDLDHLVDSQLSVGENCVGMTVDWLPRAHFRMRHCSS